MNIELVLYKIIMYLNCVFEIYLLHNFLTALFPIYEDRKWMVRLEAFGCITAIFFINHLGIPLLNTVSIPLIYLLFVWLVFHIELKYNFPYVLFYYLILAVSEVVFGYVYPILGVDVTQTDIKRIIFLILQNMVRFIVIQVIKQKHDIPHEKDSYQYTKNLYLFPVAAMVLLNGFMVQTKLYGNILISLGAILLILSSITIFSVVEKLLRAQKVIRDNEIVLLKTNLEEQHFKRMEEINKEYAGYLHDINHVLRTIGHLAETENNQEVKKLTIEAAESLRVKSLMHRKSYIGDAITNAIISERERIAIEKKVSFHIKIQYGVDLSFISDLDKIRILGNLLDNALEAAAACENGYVTLDIYQGNDSIVFFRIKNNFKCKNKKKGNRYLTIKEDKTRHGFGLDNVTELSHKYNGVINISDDNNTFTVMLLLSNVQISEKS